MPYLTPERYADLADRHIDEATDERLALAEGLLKARLGPAGRAALPAPGALTDDERAAVEQWLARCVATLAEHGDTPAAVEQIRLGRFAVTPGEGSGPLQALGFADALLAASGLIRRGIRTGSRRFSPEQDRYSI